MIDGNLVTISWQTPNAARAWVEYGFSADELTAIATDVRGPETEDTMHEVVIDSTSRGAVYFRLATAAGAIGDENGIPFKASAIESGVEGGSQAIDLTHTSAVETAAGTNRIGIQAGHWPNDAGSLSCDKVYQEKDNTYGVATLAAEMLRRYGYTVDVFGANDGAQRGYTADAYVALHNDWCAGSNSGFKVSRYGGAAGTGLNGSGDASDRLVNAVWDRYQRVTKLAKDQSPGHFTSNMLYYYALGWIAPATPGVIIEMAWWSGDRDMLLNHRGTLAAGVAESVLAHLGRSDGDDLREISSGQSLSGNISPSNDIDTAYFSGNQGQTVTIAMSKSGGSLDTYLELYGPDGIKVASNDDSNGTYDSRINNFNLPRTGRYRILSRSYAHSSSGGYTLQLNPSGGTASCPNGQFRAEYFNNRSLSGSPVFTRCESAINNDWGGGGPGNGVPNDNFSVRWVGRFEFANGTYRFLARADDGIRVKLDGSTVIDAWRDQAPTDYAQDRTVSAGTREVIVEYYENGGGAVAQVRWERPQTTCTNQYKAEYWSNRSLSGGPVFTRCENWPLTWDWGGGSPGNGVPNDGFSARWTGRAGINAGTYTFIARADDGVRVWLDNNLIIDAWRDQGPTEYRTNRTVTSGEHSLKIEYYENGGGAVAQFRWEPASGGSGNLAANRPADAWSQESSAYSPGKGNDGNNGTRWSSRISPTLGEQRWWTDLGSGRTFSRVKINWEGAYAARYRILFSNDLSTWYCYCSTFYTRSSAGWAEHTFPAVTYRYIGVQMLNRAPLMQNYSFYELEAYNGSGLLNEPGPSTQTVEEPSVLPEGSVPDPDS
jgi:N-acetylmuramoyl-L-alanine amidase